MLAHFRPEARDREAELADRGVFMGREVYQAAYHVDQGAEPVLVMHDLESRCFGRGRLVSRSELGVEAALAVVALYGLADGSGGRYRELAELCADRFLRGEPFPAGRRAARRFSCRGGAVLTWIRFKPVR